MQIIGISGKAQAGKSTGALFCVGHHLIRLGAIEDFGIDENILKVKPTNEDWVDIDFPTFEFAPIEVKAAFQVLIGQHVNIISFADELKLHCINVLGLPYESVYGTNEQKNKSLEHLTWESFSHIKYSIPKGEKKKTGPISGREVLQFVGTEVFRKIDTNIWVNAFKRRAMRSNSGIIIVPDVRFPNEVDAIHELGGKVIRLMRAPIESDHESEVALDPPYDQSSFDYVIDNNGVTLEDYLSNVRCIFDSIIA